MRLVTLSSLRHRVKRIAVGLLASDGTSLTSHWSRLGVLNYGSSS
jgi:hypothetical protein